MRVWWYGGTELGEQTRSAAVSAAAPGRINITVMFAREVTQDADSDGVWQTREFIIIWQEWSGEVAEGMVWARRTGRRRWLVESRQASGGDGGGPEHKDQKLAQARLRTDCKDTRSTNTGRPERYYQGSWTNDLTKCGWKARVYMLVRWWTDGWQVSWWTTGVLDLVIIQQRPGRYATPTTHKHRDHKERPTGKHKKHKDGENKGKHWEKTESWLPSWQ